MGDKGVGKGKSGRVWDMWAAPGSSWHVSGGWLCPFQAGQEMGAAVPAPSPCHRPGPPGRRDFPEGRRPKVTGSWARMVLHKYRGVKALEVSFSSSGGIRQFKFGLKKPGICKIQEDGLWEHPNGGSLGCSSEVVALRGCHGLVLTRYNTRELLHCRSRPPLDLISWTAPVCREDLSPTCATPSPSQDTQHP